MNHVDITPRSWSGYDAAQMGAFVTALVEASSRAASAKSPGIETLTIRRHKVVILLRGNMGDPLPAPIAEVVERARARCPWDAPEDG